MGIIQLLNKVVLNGFFCNAIFTKGKVYTLVCLYQNVTNPLDEYLFWLSKCLFCRASKQQHFRNLKLR